MGSTGGLFYAADHFMGGLVHSDRKGLLLCANIWYTFCIEQPPILLSLAQIIIIFITNQKRW